MRAFLGTVTGLLMTLSAGLAQADDTASVMCEQFAIKGATKTVEPTPTFRDDFSPKHHAPRNIPIEVELPDAGRPTFISLSFNQAPTWCTHRTRNGSTASN